MKCMSCGVSIPPEWKGCLERNECPACLKEIMNESAQELLSELAGAMKQMPNDPQGLAGWLLSNYRLTKVGTGEPVQSFYDQRVVQHQHSQQNNNVTDFMQRSGASKMSDAQIKLAEIKARQQKQPGSFKPVMDQIASNIIEEEEELEYEYNQSLEDEEYIPPAESAAQLLVQNSGGYLIKKDVQELPPEVLGALANVVSNSGEEGTETEVAKALEENNRLKRLKAQQALRNGGFRGSQ